MTPSNVPEEPTGIPYDPASPRVRDALYTSENGSSTLFPGPRNYPYDPESPPFADPKHCSGDEGHALRLSMTEKMNAFRASKQAARLAQARKEAGSTDAQTPKFVSSPFMPYAGPNPGGPCTDVYPRSGNVAGAREEGRSVGEVEGEDITAQSRSVSELQVRSKKNGEQGREAQGSEVQAKVKKITGVREDGTEDWVLVERVPS